MPSLQVNYCQQKNSKAGNPFLGIWVVFLNSSDHSGSEVHFIICHFSAAIFRQILRQNNDKN
jgi:hypothetical protein